MQSVHNSIVPQNNILQDCKHILLLSLFHEPLLTARDVLSTSSVTTFALSALCQGASTLSSRCVLATSSKIPAGFCLSTCAVFSAVSSAFPGMHSSCTLPLRFFPHFSLQLYQPPSPPTLPSRLQGLHSSRTSLCPTQANFQHVRSCSCPLIVPKNRFCLS
jgi:hypothetical protein